jgi:hypothetical protein
MRKMMRGWAAGLAVAMLGLCAARADERSFSFVYEPVVLPKGAVEFEQWLSGRIGRDGGDYARWDLREEFEFGLTDRLTTALYLNFKDEFFSPDDEAEEGKDTFSFTGISSEWKYSILSPHTHPVGIVAYLEATSDGAHEHELEEKLIFGTVGDVWNSAFNVTLEQEWEREDGETEKESALQFSAGLSRKLSQAWSAGLEALHTRVYLDHSLNEEEYSATFAGPNVHYATAKWWATLTVMPQIYGDGDEADGNLQLSHSERIQTRLIAGVNF